MSFHSVKTAGTLLKSFPFTSCTSQSQTKGTGTIKRSALHGSYPGRAMGILNKALSTFCLPGEMFKLQYSIGCVLLDIGAPAFAFLQKTSPCALKAEFGVMGKKGTF